MIRTTNDTRSTTFSSLCRTALAAVLAAGLMIPSAGFAAYADEPDGGGGSSQAAKALTQGAGGILEEVSGTAFQVEEESQIALASAPNPQAEDTVVGGMTISGGVAGADYTVSGTTVVVKTDALLTLKGTLTNGTVRIEAGVKANIILDSVTITSQELDSPINLMATGSELRLTIADGSTNLLQATGAVASKKSKSAAGIHCGAGSTLYIDDGRPNWSGDHHVEVYAGVVAEDAVLDDGTEVKAGDPLSSLASDNPGTLTVKGGYHSAAIGAGPLEMAGLMVFDGGNIFAYAWGGSNQNGGSGTAIGVTNAASKDDHRSGGAAIGGSHGGGATDMVFNGGNIVAAGSYHGAGVGAGWSNLSTTLNYLPASQQTGASSVKTSLVCGNITINGGRIVSQGYAHGNAFGGACGTTANNCTIRVTGGTLLPYSFVGKDAGGGAQNKKDIGGSGGRVIISGGSVRLSGAQSAKFESTDNKAYSDDEFKNEVAPITIDLSDDLGAIDAPIEYWELQVDGKPIEYGAPTELDKGNLYLWLSNEDAKKDVKIVLHYKDADNNIVKVEPLETQGGGSTAKRWIPFEMKEEYFPGGLTKPYDGTPIEKWSLAKNPVSITTSTETRTLNDDTYVTFKYQRIDDEGNPLEEFTTGTEMPTDTGRMAFRMESTQFGNDEKLTSYWGHSTEGICEITPVPAILHIDSVEWGYLNEATGAWSPITQDQVDAGEAGNRLKLSFYVRSANSTALTCAAPTGSFQVKIDGEEVGSPVGLTEEAMRESAYSSIAWEDIDGRHATRVTYYLDPTNKDALLKLLEGADGAEHMVNIEYIADKNYIQGVEENPDNAQEDEAFIVPVPPKGEVEPDGPVKIEDPDPVDPDPDNPTGKMTVIRKTITANYSDFHKKDAEIADFFAMAVSSNSSAPTTYDVSNGAVADIVWDDEKDAPALTDDGKLQIQVSSCGSSVITLEQKANALYTGIKYILTVNVLPDASLVPQVQIRMISNNLTHPGQPARPGDEIEYLVSGLNLTEGSAWQAATLLDTLDSRLELDRDSVRLASNYATPDRDTTLGTPAFYKDFDWNTLTWENLPVGQYIENGQQVSKMVGSVYGGQSTTLRFTATLKAGTAGRPASPDDPADIKNEPGGEGGYGTPEDSIVPGQEPDVDPTPLPEGNIVVVGDDPKTDDPDPDGDPDDDKKQPDDPGTVTPLPIIPKDPVVVPDPDDPTSSPDITVVKTAENLTHPDAKRAIVGDEIEYTVVLANSAADSAWYDAVIRDTLPAGLEPVSDSFKLVDGAGASIKVSDEVYVEKTRTIALYVGDLYGGEQATLTFRCTVTPEAAGGSIGNVAFAFGDTPSEKWEKDHPTDPDGPADPDDPNNPGTDPGDKPGEGDDNPGGTPTPKPKPNPGDPFVPEVPDGADDPWEDFDWDNYPENKPQPSNQDKPAAPNDPDKGVLPGDPVEESLAVDLIGENLTRNIADTMVGDHIRYTLTFTNTQAHTSLMLSALRNQVPDGLTLVPGSITVTVPEPAQPFAAARAVLPLTAAAPIALAAEAYVDDATVTYPVNDASYDEGTRTMAVNAGELAGGKSVVLVFEAVVGPKAAGKTIVDNGWGHGTVPTYYADDDKDPAISTTFVPVGGLAAYMAQPGTRTLAAEHVIPVKDVIDPEDGAITVKKEAENLTTRGGDTYVGDRIRYTVTLANATPGSAWYDAVISDVVPKGIDVDTAKVELKLADGKVIPVKDAYDSETRRLAVNVGDVAGGTAVQLIFEAVVTEGAVDADVGNVAVAYGTLPSESDPKRFDEGTVLPEPGTGFNPEEGWAAFEESHAGVTSGNPVYPSANVTARGGVKPAENGFGTRLAQTGDSVMGIVLLMTLAAVTSLLMVVLAGRRREERE